MSFTFPIQYNKIYRTFGLLYKDVFGDGLDGVHIGNDYGAPFDTSVYSILDGVVLYSLELGGFGSLNPSTPGGCIIIKHTNKSGKPFLAIYGHVRRFVIKDEIIKEGTVIGKLLNFKNGGSSYTHLHFGIYENENIELKHLGYISENSNLGYWRDDRVYLKEKVA